MKKKLLLLLTVIVVVAAISCVVLTGCNTSSRDENTVLRFTAPEGTPALAMLRLVADNKAIDGTQMEYDVVKPNLIVQELATAKSDLVIMPVNAGATKIRDGADYKLVSIAVNGSLYMIGNKDGSNEITVDDLKGKKIACIGQAAVPGMVFRYVISKNNLSIKSLDEVPVPNAANNEISVKYINDGNEAAGLISSNKVDYAVVGEPAATALKGKLGLNAEMNMQTAYAACSAEGIDNYPQAGLFVKTALAKDKKFMKALFEALAASKEWVLANKADVAAFAKQNLYESAVFPAGSIDRCAINAQKITDNEKKEVVAFLKSVAPKDADGNVVDWDNVKLF